MIAARRGGRRQVATRAVLGALLLCSVSATLPTARAQAQNDARVRTPTRGIDQLADRIAAHAAESGAEAPVGLWARGESPELARAFVTVLAAELARRKLPAVPIEAVDAIRAEEEARAKGLRSLLRMQLGLEAGLLHARGDLLGTWVNFWSGAQATRPPSPAAGLEASVDADAHALALAAAPIPVSPPPALAPQTGEVRMVQAVFARLPRQTAALAAGDLDGDGRDEVIALTDEELLVFGPDGKLLVRRELRHLPHSPTPVREPYGSLAVLPSSSAAPARLAAFSAQRARGELLTLEQNRSSLRPLATFTADEAPLARLGDDPLLGRHDAGRTTFAPTLTRNGTPAMALPRAFTTLTSYVGAGGPELLAVFPNGAGHWRADLTAAEPRSLELRGLGAGTALADVDGDGYAELVTSEPHFAPNPEALRVLRAPALAGAASLDSVRFRKELARGRILQIAGADLDGQRAHSLIVAVWLPDGSTELQVQRRVK